MKESSTCPKCRSRRQWVIEPFRVPSETGAGATLRVVNDQPKPGSSLFRAASPHGSVDLYVCADCGFSELWARDFATLSHDPAAGVTFRDQSDAPQGPFR
jgi:predicted nucleic-acid-binding Zn-ribbon protein